MRYLDKTKDSMLIEAYNTTGRFNIVGTDQIPEFVIAGKFNYGDDAAIAELSVAALYELVADEYVRHISGNLYVITAYGRDYVNTVLRDLYPGIHSVEQA